MADDYNTPAAIGHNQPPPQTLDDQAKEAIEAALAKLLPRLTQLEESAKRAKAEDRETAAKVSDLVAMFAQLAERVDMAHREVKQPYLDAGRVVDGRANALRERISDARVTLEGMLTAFQRAEAKKIADLRAAERAAEAADPEPTAAASHAETDKRRVAIHGDYGSSARLTDVLVIEKVDVKRLPKTFLERPKVLAIIEAEAKVVIRAGGKVTGVTSNTTQKSRVRKGG